MHLYLIKVFILLNPTFEWYVINGNLGTEESVSDNPFKKGQPFEMFTVIKSEGYKVYVNGKELCTFKHRIPLEKRDCCSLSLGVDQLWKPDGRF
uniref:Galectin n=1 Tax=Sinocyclocheilus rhinocerous TaxID=307959 RepID=A0A673IKZ0_9TELE